MNKFIDNIELNKLEMESNKTVLESRPHRLMILLTTRCNLDCIMCDRVKRKRHFTIPLEVIEKIYPLLPFTTWLNWQGGEIFLVEYFKDIFMKITEYPHVFQNILTNGLLIDSQWAELLSNSNSGVTYSIDAVTKTTYEKIRKGSRFNDLIKSCEAMNKSRIKYRSSNGLEITSVVMKSNYKELSLFPEFCKNFGFTSLRFDYLHPEVIPEEDIILSNDLQSCAYLRSKLPEIKQECREKNIGFHCTFENYLYGNAKLNDALRPKEQNLPRSGFVCKLPWQQFTVLANEKADVQPDCACIHTVGNLNEDTLEELWNGERMRRYRENIINNQIKNFCSKKCLIDIGMA